MNPPNNFRELIDKFFEVADAAVPVIIALAFAVFFWGLVKFIFRAGGDEKAVAEGKKLMLWGIIALFILMSFMAIIIFFYRDIGFSRPFGLPTFDIPAVPLDN